MHMGSPPHTVFYRDGQLQPPDDEYDNDYNFLMAAPQEARDLAYASLDRDEEEVPCCWLDLQTKQCRFYEFRPDICRDFEVGSEACIGSRRLYGLS